MHVALAGSWIDRARARYIRDIRGAEVVAQHHHHGYSKSRSRAPHHGMMHGTCMITRVHENRFSCTLDDQSQLESRQVISKDLSTAVNANGNGEYEVRGPKPRGGLGLE